MYAASLFADGKSTWKRAALEGGIVLHNVKHVLLQFSRTVRPRAGSLVKAGTQVLDRQWRSLKDVERMLAKKFRDQVKDRSCKPKPLAMCLQLAVPGGSSVGCIPSYKWDTYDT